MAFNFEIIDHPKMKTISEQQSSELYTDYCWVSPKEIPTTPLGADWKPKPSVMVPLYETHADRIKNFEVRPDDVWLISFPKTGTTWSQEMVWCICNNLDYKQAKEVNLFARFPFIEIAGIANFPFPAKPIDMLEKMPSPRFIKTHLPVALLPDQLWTVKPKIVYIRRNPKDTVVSWFHHHQLLHGYYGNLDDFVEAFLADMTMYSPYHEHILEYCELAKTESNILSIRYEDMKMDIGEVIKKTADFFGVKLNFVQIDILADHLSLKSMRANKSINYEEITLFTLAESKIENKEGMRFIRKGQVGGYKDELTAAHIAKLEQMTKSKAKTAEDLLLFSEI